MFASVNFSEYIDNRIAFYNSLKSFVVQEEHLSDPIEIDRNFMDRLNNNFQKFLQRRLEPTKFTRAENKELKELMKNVFPETMQIFNHHDPTIYWFKINYSMGLTNDTIVNEYANVRQEYKGKGWWTQVSKVRSSSTTEILYLGKIETAFQNRFIQHIGLGHSFTTSLKLQMWMNRVEGMSLTFQFLKLDRKWKKYTEDIEKVLWDVTQPLLGASSRIKNAEVPQNGS